MEAAVGPPKTCTFESTWRPSTSRACSSLLPCQDCLASRRTQVDQGGPGALSEAGAVWSPCSYKAPLLGTASPYCAPRWGARHGGCPTRAPPRSMLARFVPVSAQRATCPTRLVSADVIPPLRDAGVCASVLPASGPWPCLVALVGTAGVAAAACPWLSAATRFACARLRLLATAIDY